MLMLCLCKKPTTITSDGDVLCCKCGKVFGQEDIVNPESPAKLSLALRKIKGTKNEPNPKHTKRLHIYKDDLNVVSSVCSKLNLPRAFEDDVWVAYKELREYSMQRPNSVAFAIYRVVRLNDLPILDSDIKNAVEVLFNVQRVPDYLAVMSEVNKIEQSKPGSYLLTDKRRTKSSRYYLLTHVKRATRKHKNVPFDLLLSYAEPRFNVSTFGNIDTRAKRVVSQILVKMNVK